MTITLRSLNEIRQFFANNTTPYYFISASNFNLMMMHNWVKNWHNINLINCFDYQHPNVVMVPDDPSRVFESIEEINHYLLNSPAAQQLIAQHQYHGKVIFLFFDPALEQRCRELGLEVILPPNQLVKQIDSKIVTTEIGNEVNVASVPNLLCHIGSYQQLCELAQQHQLGNRWVIQTPYGDSGKTTFFIQSEADYLAVAKQIEAEDQVKVMRWIRCAGTAIEACATRWGTLVGPLLTEMIGDPALTPYSGGWCGNELYQAAYSPEIRQQVQAKTERIGNALYARGYRGYFELDYLIDLDDQQVYLGELNARITGITAMTNLSDFSQQQLPLFLFHLLEYNPEIELAIDLAELNQALLQQGAKGLAAQAILKYTDDTLKIITQAPVTGVYQLEAQQLTLLHPSYNRREAMGENQAFILRIMQVGEYAYHGGDLAILFVNQIIRSPEGKLNDNGQRWVAALKQSFSFRHLSQEERAAIARVQTPANIKSGPNV